MPDKLTDREIVKALPFLAKCCKDEYNDIRVDKVLLGAFDLINRLQAENERLKKGWKADIQLTGEAKAEAYKECIEKVIETASVIKANAFQGCYVISKGNLDNLLKKLVGEDK